MNLQWISLNHTKIKSIGLNLFTNLSDLRNLGVIDLRNNLLTELEPWPFIRAVAVPDVKILVGAHIKKFTNTIGWNSSCTRERSPNRKIKMELDMIDNPIDHMANLINDLNFSVYERL